MRTRAYLHSLPLVALGSLSMFGALHMRVYHAWSMWCCRGWSDRKVLWHCWGDLGPGYVQQERHNLHRNLGLAAGEDKRTALLVIMDPCTVVIPQSNS